MEEATLYRERISKLLDSMDDPKALAALYQYASDLKDGKMEIEAELKHAQSEVKELKAQQDKFYSIVSFWLGSPLNTLKMLTDMMMSDSEAMDKKQLVEFGKHVQNQVDKLLVMMENLIEWSNLEVKNYTFKPTTVSLSDMLSDAVDHFKLPMDVKGISCSSSISADQAVADSRMLKLVLRNLLSNSVKFSRKGDSISVSTEQVGEGVLVRIADTGIGMGAAKVAGIFSVSRKSNQKGTANEYGFGLGMIITKALLDIHQVQLNIDSKQGSGTTVSFLLPLAKPE